MNSKTFQIPDESEIETPTYEELFHEMDQLLSLASSDEKLDQHFNDWQKLPN